MGDGVKIAVIDSGINPNLAEFSGRIDPASADVVANRGVTDTEGHGTSVAGVAAAGRNGSEIMGVAFQSTILSFNSSNPADCSTEDGCVHYDYDIAEGVDLARANGAKVINISLGGSTPTSTLANAISRATRAGIVVVMSAGNESAANPGDLALVSAQQSGNGAFIIAGAHDADRQMASFSNKAGTGAAYYLTALGDGVRSFDHTGQAFLFSGTSYSAPVISGAAALLASAFPNLTGAQIVELLLSTADDAGATGQDGVFGRGILNIARAFQPQGQTSLAGSAAPVSLSDNGQTSGAMGDATGEMTGAIILDGYSRAYAIDLARTLARAPQDRPLGQALDGHVRSAVAANGATAVTLTINREIESQPWVGLAQMGLTREDSRRAKLIAGSALTRLTPETAVAFGISESGRTLQQRLANHQDNAFLVARDPLARNGFFAEAGTSIGVRHDVGPVALTVTNENGEVWNPGPRRTVRQPGYSISAVTADRRIGPATLSLGLSRLKEEETVLGGRFGSAFTNDGATSHFLDGTASFDLGRGWGAFASYRRGWTSLPGSGALVDRGRLSTDAWAVDLSKRGAFLGGDKIAFRIMQPLRVSSGGFDLTLPVSYDYATGAVGYEQRYFNLAPTGREIDFEAAYSVGLWGGDLGLNAFYRTEPGHIQVIDDDLGAAIRYTLGF